VVVGVALFDPALAADMLANYAPEITAPPNGDISRVS